MPTSVIAPVSGLPPTRTVPVVGSIRPATISINVLLPQPLGPTTDTNSPGSISTLNGRRASDGVSVPTPNTLPTLSISTRTPRVPFMCLRSVITDTQPQPYFNGHGRSWESGGK